MLTRVPTYGVLRCTLIGCSGLCMCGVHYLCYIILLKLAQAYSIFAICDKKRHFDDALLCDLKLVDLDLYRQTLMRFRFRK